jgi:hypothetical protein
VELAPWARRAHALVTERDHAVQLLLLVAAELRDRRSTLLRHGAVAWSPAWGPWLLVGVDELAELVEPSAPSKAERELAAQALSLLVSIGRLGRALGVHLVGATQRPDADTLSGALRGQFDYRLARPTDEGPGRVPHDGGGRGGRPHHPGRHVEFLAPASTRPSGTGQGRSWTWRTPPTSPAPPRTYGRPCPGSTSWRVSDERPHAPPWWRPRPPCWPSWPSTRWWWSPPLPPFPTWWWRTAPGVRPRRAGAVGVLRGPPRHGRPPGGPGRHGLGRRPRVGERRPRPPSDRPFNGPGGPGPPRTPGVDTPPHRGRP